MSWWEYVVRIAPEQSQAAIAQAAGVTAPTVSRWANAKQGVDPSAAAAFARAYGRPVLEAFVAAGFLTAEEARQRPAANASLEEFSDDELIEEIRLRLQDLSRVVPAEQAGDDASVAVLRRERIRKAGQPATQAAGRTRRRPSEAGPESQDPGDMEPR